MTFRELLDGRRVRGVHGPHGGWLHTWFAHDPWIAWPIAGLAAILLAAVLLARLIFRTMGDVPWWARLGLIGATFMWWRNRRKAAGHTHTDPTQWIDLRDSHAPEQRGR